MEEMRDLGLSRPRLRAAAPDQTWQLRQSLMQRLLAFSGHTIDEVVNDRSAKNHLIYYFKWQKLMDRRSDILDLEKQWNHEK